ncbi:GNAT family N-acetyltransferase [Lachnoclostridium sp. Marseille-P6806]|uniref:GNAT family N-acetyltransferase n=1 Tax=Lachnoclostridium sp. Marseille-P6806 TaxID=2364793 RepID=UPI001031D6D8|nr:GNAT family N-acetyltransferase [Lachnoclostridium sp. Marseille-P6806]
MIIRSILEKDAENLYQMMCRLDEETNYMLYEPGERQKRTRDLSRLSASIAEAVSGSDFLMAAENENGEIAGYIRAERGRLNRIRHTAYIVIGIRRAYRRQGIGTAFFQELERWAKTNDIIRLELTVECANTGAKSLYEKQGFRVEGVRSQSMRVDGRLVDEYYMGKILG